MNSEPVLAIVNDLDDLLDISFDQPVRRAIVLGLTTVDHFRIDFLKSGLAEKLACSGFKVFAIVGPGSELAHDELDWVLEDLKYTEALTTWHDAQSFDDIASYCEAMMLDEVVQVIAVLDRPVPAYRRIADELSLRFSDTVVPAT